MMSFLQLHPETVDAKVEVTSISAAELPQVESKALVKRDNAPALRIPDLLPDPKQVWW